MGTEFKRQIQDAELDGFCAGQENERAKIVARIKEMEKTNTLNTDVYVYLWNNGWNACRKELESFLATTSQKEVVVEATFHKPSGNSDVKRML